MICVASGRGHLILVPSLPFPHWPVVWSTEFLQNIIAACWPAVQGVHETNTINTPERHGKLTFTPSLTGFATDRAVRQSEMPRRINTFRHPSSNRDVASCLYKPPVTTNSIPDQASPSDWLLPSRYKWRSDHHVTLPDTLSSRGGRIPRLSHTELVTISDEPPPLPIGPAYCRYVHR